MNLQSHLNLKCKINSIKTYYYEDDQLCRVDKRPTPYIDKKSGTKNLMKINNNKVHPVFLEKERENPRKY